MMRCLLFLIASWAVGISAFAASEPVNVASDRQALTRSGPLARADACQVIAWKSGDDVTARSNEGVRVRFEMRDADMFGFQFVAVPPVLDRQERPSQ